MRTNELNCDTLLEIDPEGGLIHFAGHRAVLFDAVAMGLLRKSLVENFGTSATRKVLTQFGFAHGWRMAESIRAQFGWDSPKDLRCAGSRLHMFEGLFRVQPGTSDALGEDGSTLVESYEAQQHLLHFGPAATPTCWTICGVLSGYLSCTEGREIFVLEDRCLAMGDATCHLVGRSRDQWVRAQANGLGSHDSGELLEQLNIPFPSMSDTLSSAENQLPARREEVDDSSGIVMKSPAMRRVMDLARRVANIESSVLITGESGVGKERVARFVHERSSRTSGPFIAVNCGAITEALLESELFGHTRGAFTGAARDRTGLFEAANHGTLLLDEIGDISPGMQQKLLRVLQEREVRRVGDNESRPIDVRILAATNRDLATRVAADQYRQDLYYRLKVIDLHVPALRERRNDILPLARRFLADARLRMKRRITGLSAGAAEQLLRHDWPGNVRELENAIERAVALARGLHVELEDLPDEVRHAAPTPNARGSVRSLDAVAKDYILAVLERNGGNRARTAEQLGIGSATLYRKLKSYSASFE